MLGEHAYTPEQYTTNIRATGAGMAASIGRIGGILGPLMVGFLMANQISVSMIFGLFSLSILLAILVILFLGKETKQTSLS